MSDTRPLKKSETLEIRIPYPTKAAFMARCREDGSSASEALRRLIDQHLADEARAPTAAPPGWGGSRQVLRLAAGALLAAAVGAIAAPTLARPVCAPAASVWSAIAPPPALHPTATRR